MVKVCKILTIYFLFILCGGSGCSLFGGFRPAEVIKHPDAPVLIAEVKGSYIRAYVYDKAKNELTDFGWIRLSNSNAKGWTLLKYDWETFIEKKERRSVSDTKMRARALARRKAEVKARLLDELRARALIKAKAEEYDKIGKGSLDILNEARAKARETGSR